MRIEHIGDATLYEGDCLAILPLLGKVDAVVTDPPYGMKWNTDSSRFSGGHRESVARRGQGVKDWGSVVADDQPFDPAPFLSYPRVVLFGSNHFAQRLPVGTTLVWIKRLESAYGSFLSDAELAWCKGGLGVYCRRDQTLMATAKERKHPTEKPVGIMEWAIERCNGTLDNTLIPETILDPFMGSGTTGVACAKLGRKFIGIEIEERYFDIACRRIEEAYKQPDMFIEPPAKQTQLGLIFDVEKQ